MHFQRTLRGLPSPAGSRFAIIAAGAPLDRILEASVDHLIRSLYCRELTYGEFARKKYGFIRRAAELNSSIHEAGTQRDPEILGRTLRQLVYFKLSCGVYLRRLDTRRPGTGHNRGDLYT